MDYNSQNPYEQNSGTNPYDQSNGTNPYMQSNGTQGQNPYDQSGTPSQDIYGQQGAYSQGTQDSGQNSYQQSNYQQSPYQQNPYQQNPYQQNIYGQSGYQQPPYQNYQNPYVGDMEEPMSVKEWLIVDLLMLIPCVNLILVFVWAFSSSEKKSKSNYFKANLIFAGCILAFYLVLVIFAAAAGMVTAFY